MTLISSRRTFLKTLGSAAASASIAGLLSEAVAQEGPPLRFVVLYNPHGYAPNLWRPRAPGGGEAAEANWTLDFDPDAALAPLEGHKSSLTLVEGLDWQCLYKPNSVGLLGHAGAELAMLTGRDARGASDRRATGESLDMFLARHLAVKPFLYKHGGYAGKATAASFGPGGEAVPLVYEPKELYRAWFAGVSPTQASEDPSAAARVRAEASVLDFLKGEASGLRARLAGPERRKLEAHLDALSLIEKRLQAAPKSAECRPPADPDPQGDATDRHRAVLETLAAALACNLTRVATVMMDAGNYMPWLELGGQDRHVHNDVAHGYRPEDETSGRYLARIQRWYAEHVSYFFDLLKQMPEGGKTVYDHTIVLWINELGNPAEHACNNIPIVIGGGGGAHRKGRYLRFDTNGYKGPPTAHNLLLTSLANEFGAGLDHFGDPELAGELPGLL